MLNRKLLFALATTTLLSSCNGGINLTVPAAPQVETGPIVVDPNPGTTPTPAPGTTPTPAPGTTPTPAPGTTPTPTPPTVAKNRMFVLSALLKSINTPSSGFFNYACYREARRAGIRGKFVAFSATSDAEFGKKYKVNGYLYQKFRGVENRIANSYQDLIAGRNSPIFASAWQSCFDPSVRNYVWTGQRNFALPASPAENCNNWSTDQGGAIVGLVGASGSEAIASQTVSCDTFQRLYCIEINEF